MAKGEDREGSNRMITFPGWLCAQVRIYLSHPCRRGFDLLRFRGE